MPLHYSRKFTILVVNEKKINTIPNTNANHILLQQKKISQVRWQDLNPQQKGCQLRAAGQHFCPLGHEAPRLV